MPTLERPNPPIGRRLLDFGRLVLRRFFAQGMTVYAPALAYRGLLALVPFVLFFFALVEIFGLEGSFPRLTLILLRIGGQDAGTGSIVDVPLQGLFSVSAVVGFYSMSAGARVFMRALNEAHGVPEQRSPLERGIFSAVFLPGLAAVAAGAVFLLLLTSRVLVWIAGWIGFAPFLSLLGSWLRTPIAIVFLVASVAVAYRYSPAQRPPWRAVAAGAGVAVVLWTAASLGFGLAVATVLDYGSTYGGLGAAVALLVYLHLTAIVLLLGAQVSAVLAGAPLEASPPFR